MICQTNSTNGNGEESEVKVHMLHYAFGLMCVKDMIPWSNSTLKANSLGEDYLSSYKQTTGLFPNQCETLEH